MGIVINRPADELSFDDMLEQLEIPSETNSSDHHLFFGGPVETGRGFVLHSGDYSGQDGTLRVNDFFAMTATRDILQDIANGQGPDQVLPALGYAGWGPGQLEGEIQQNAWLTVDADQAIVFSKENKSKWEAALAKLGISPLMLSAEGGRACGCQVQHAPISSCHKYPRRRLKIAERSEARRPRESTAQRG